MNKCTPATLPGQSLACPCRLESHDAKLGAGFAQSAELSILGVLSVLPTSAQTASNGHRESRADMPARHSSQVSALIQRLARRSSSSSDNIRKAMTAFLSLDDTTPPSGSVHSMAPRDSSSMIFQ